jgi:hypothetical protein
MELFDKESLYEIKKATTTQYYVPAELFDGMQYRLFAFWDKDTRRLVVATHGMVKKTWKVPRKEIAKAEALMKKYYESK